MENGIEVKNCLVDGHIIMNVAKIWVTVERGSSGSKRTGGVTLEMPTGGALPLAIQYAEGEQPEGTLSLDEITLTIQKLFEYVGKGF